MNFLLGVERVLLTNLAQIHHEQKMIDDKTMTGDNHLEYRKLIHTSLRNQIIFLGLAYFYGYDTLHCALELLKHTKHLVLYRTIGDFPRRLYQFHGNKNQLPVYTLSTSNFCTCTFYKEHILIKQDHFACPHNIAVKLYEQMCPTNADVDIEMFDVADDYLINKLTKLVEQSCEFFSQ